MKVADVHSAGQMKKRASVLQSKTKKPVRFEAAEGARKSVARWLDSPQMIGSEFLWLGRFYDRLHIATRQYARLVRNWVKSMGLEPSTCGTYSMRRTKISRIYKNAGNLHTVQRR